MPPIITILVVLFAALAVIVFITERKPTTMTREQAAAFNKWMKILVPVLMIVMAISFFMRP